MTDQERARDFIVTHITDDAPIEELTETTADLAAAFHAIRLAERAAIVAFVRRRYVADALALAVERGDHAS